MGTGLEYNLADGHGGSASGFGSRSSRRVVRSHAAAPHQGVPPAVPRRSGSFSSSSASAARRLLHSTAEQHPRVEAMLRSVAAGAGRDPGSWMPEDSRGGRAGAGAGAGGGGGGGEIGDMA